MKFTNNLFIVVMLGLVISSCTQNESEVSFVENQVNVGILHNEGLDYVLVQLQTNNNSLRSSSVISTAQIASVSHDYVQTVPQYSAAMASADINLLTQQLDVAIANLNSVGIQQYWSKLVNNNVFKNLQLSSLELKFIGDIEQIFKNLNNTNLSFAQQYSYIKENVSSIKKSQDINILLNSNQGELLSGLLEITNSSADYWNDYVTTHPDIPNIPLPYIVQLDAAGYLIGWGKAYYDDRDNPNGGSNEAARNRVGKGLWAALSASSLGMVRVAYGNSVTTNNISKDMENYVYGW